MSARIVVITERPGGAWYPVLDGERVILPGYEDAFLGKIAAFEQVVALAKTWEGPTEIHYQPCREFARTVQGKPATLDLGDRVFQYQGDSRVEGRVVEAIHSDGTPRIDSDGAPILAIRGDDGSLYGELSGWYRLS
jgi:hypothetical protein